VCFEHQFDDIEVLEEARVDLLDCQGPPTVVVRQDGCRHEGRDLHGKFSGQRRSLQVCLSTRCSSGCDQAVNNVPGRYI